MPRKPKDPAGDSPPAGAGQDGEPTVADDNENRSSETQVVLPAEDEPVRCGGHVLTDDGWVLEDGPAPADNAESDSAEQEQE